MSASKSKKVNGNRKPKQNRVRRRRAPRKKGLGWEQASGMKAANVGVTTVKTIRRPVQKFLPNGNLLVTHCEFLRKVKGSVDFSISTSDPINPGMPAQFKWLWPIANQYESYKFHKLDYEFVNSKAGTFGGDVIMGIDYDPSDPSPFNEDELQSYWGSKTGQICRPLTYKADMKSLHKIGPTRYTRMGGSPADIKLYDSGNFFIATTDCADTSTIGRLFVHYVVELSTPQISPGNILSVGLSPAAETQAAPLGTSFVESHGYLDVTWLSGTTFSIDVPGQYNIVWVSVGTVITAGVKISSNTGGSTFATSVAEVINSASTSSVSAQQVRVMSASDVFTVASTATTITGVSIFVMPYAY